MGNDNWRVIASTAAITFAGVKFIDLAIKSWNKRTAASYSGSDNEKDVKLAKRLRRLENTIICFTGSNLLVIMLS